MKMTSINSPAAGLMNMIDALSPVQRRDYNKFRCLVEDYIDAGSPGRCHSLAGDVYKLLCCMPKRLFVCCIEDVLQRAFNANPDIVPSYIKLFEQIKNAAIRLENGQLFPISQAISGYCMKHPDAESIEDVGKFRRKLPLINELYRMNLIQRGYYKFFAKMFANLRRGEVGIAFLYEILANVDWLTEHASTMTPSGGSSSNNNNNNNNKDNNGNSDNSYSLDQDFWVECATVFNEACRKGMVTNSNLLNNIYKLLESIKKKTKFYSLTINRGELISPIDDPAIVTKIPSAGKVPRSPSSSSSVCPHNGLSSQHTTPLPSALEQDRPSSLSAPQPLLGAQAIIQPPVPLISEVRLAMQTLARYPEQFAICASHIQRLLEGYCVTSKDTFVGAIDEMLNECLNADSRTFASYMLLLDHLTKTLPPVPLRKAVVQSAMQIHRLETVDHVVEFCSSFRLSNELCRLGLLQSHVFKHYVNELAKPERDLSYLFTYEVMRNVDRLIDTGIAKLNGLEVAFWESCAERLTKAASNRRLVTAEKEKEIQRFLSQVREKGGWARAKIQRPFQSAANHQPQQLQTQTSQNHHQQQQQMFPPISQTVTIAAPKTSPEPTAKLMSQLSLNQQQKITSPQVPSQSASLAISPNVAGLQFHPKVQRETSIVDDAEFRSLIDLISQVNNTNYESTARLFKPKLQAISPIAFTEAVELILAKLFLQIDGEQSLEDAAKLCIAFYRQDYGSGKNFTLELQKACQKYLSTKCPTAEAIERARVRLRSSSDLSSNSISSHEIGQLEVLLKRKNIGALKLISKLFELKHLNFTFLLSLADTLLARKSEDGLEGLAELLSRIGREFEAQVLAKAMIEWWGHFCEELSDLAKSSQSTPKMKQLASEILTAKKNGWQSVDPNLQATKQRFQALLAELSPELLAKAPGDYVNVATRIRSYVDSESNSSGLLSSTMVLDACLAKIQELLTRIASMKTVSSPPRASYVKIPSPGFAAAVKLPDAAPKPRKPSRWDQPPPAQKIAAAEIAIKLQNLKPQSPPQKAASTSNIQQLLLSLGSSSDSFSEKPKSQPVQVRLPTLGGAGASKQPHAIRGNGSFVAFGDVAVSPVASNASKAKPEQQRTPSDLHKIWPGFQILKQQAQMAQQQVVAQQSTTFSSNPVMFHKQPFFQSMTSGSWQQQQSSQAIPLQFGHQQSKNYASLSTNKTLTYTKSNRTTSWFQQQQQETISSSNNKPFESSTQRQHSLFAKLDAFDFKPSPHVEVPKLVIKQISETTEQQPQQQQQQQQQQEKTEVKTEKLASSQEAITDDASAKQRSRTSTSSSSTVSIEEPHGDVIDLLTDLQTQSAAAAVNDDKTSEEAEKTHEHDDTAKLQPRDIEMHDGDSATTTTTSA